MTAAKQFDAQLWSTAHHEAGHVVVALHKGIPIEKATIIREETETGVVYGSAWHPGVLGFHAATAREQRSIAKDIILVAYAGLHAQRLVEPDACASHAAWDHEQAFERSRAYGVLPRGMGFVGDDVHIAFLQKLDAESRRLVHKLRGPIGVLAEALVERLEMDGEQIEAVVLPALRARN